MKKYILGISLVFLMVFVFTPVAKASTLGDLMTQIKTLQKQVTDLSSKMSEFVLKSVSSVSIPVAKNISSAPVTKVGSTLSDATLTQPCNNYVYDPQWNGPTSPGSNTGNGVLFNAQYIAFDSTGNVYVTDYNRIQKFTSNGTFITQYYPGGAASIHGIAINSIGDVYVAMGDSIHKFTPSLIPVSQFGSLGSGNGQFSYTRGIAIDSSDNIYVVDSGSSMYGQNNRIQKFDSNGTFISTFGWGVKNGANQFQICINNCQGGIQGSGDGQLSSSEGIAIDSFNNIYVVDTENNRIQKFDSSGAFITKWGIQGSGINQFNYPFGIAIDSNDYIYVSDRMNNRIQKFDSNNMYITQFGNSYLNGGQGPHGLAVNPLGIVYVVDHYYIKKFKPLCITCSAGQKIGDANNDGGINAFDAQLIAQIFTGIIPMPTNKCCVDTNGDNAVNSTDSSMVMNYFVHLLPSGLTGQMCQ